MPRFTHQPSALVARVAKDRATFKGMRVGLYGGSFNPGHDGHRHVALEALKRLDLDYVLLMVSPGNPLKTRADMASYEARLESALEVADCHPRILASDIEARIGTRYTAETIETLVGLMPQTQFVWMMGADNMMQFRHWHRWDDIARQLPIAIFDRPEYSVGGFASKFARVFGRHQVKPSALLHHSAPNWCFVRMPRHPASATAIRQRLGQKWATP